MNVVNKNLAAGLDINLEDLSNQAAPTIGDQTVGNIVSNIVSDYILPAAGLVLFFYLLLGGYQIMTAAGNPKQVSAGQAKIQNAIVGFVIMFVAYWLTQIILRLFGLTSVTEFVQ